MLWAMDIIGSNMMKKVIHAWKQPVVGLASRQHWGHPIQCVDGRVVTWNDEQCHWTFL